MFPIVEIEWNDAHSCLRDSTVKRAAKNVGVKTLSVGYLLGQSDDGLTIVTDCWPGDDSHGFAEHFIPWGMVNRWWKICTV
jgi:hypothetical protein